VPWSRVSGVLLSGRAAARRACRLSGRTPARSSSRPSLRRWCLPGGFASQTPQRAIRRTDPSIGLRDLGVGGGAPSAILNSQSRNRLGQLCGSGEMPLSSTPSLPYCWPSLSRSSIARRGALPGSGVSFQHHLTPTLVNLPSHIFCQCAKLQVLS
jgi:hypothetical protein